jgi:hypothetical protein
MEDTTGDAVNWLLSSTEPAVRLLARRDLLGQDVLHTDEVLDGSMVRTLLSGQCPDGGFGSIPAVCSRLGLGRDPRVELAGDPGARCACGGLAHRRAVPRTSAVSLAAHRGGHPPGLAGPALSPVLALRHPPLQALLVLSRMRLTGDPRCSDALAVLQRRRRPDGRWQPGGYWWKPPGTPGGTVEVVDWGRSAPSATRR